MNHGVSPPLATPCLKEAHEYKMSNQARGKLCNLSVNSCSLLNIRMLDLLWYHSEALTACHDENQVKRALTHCVGSC